MRLATILLSVVLAAASACRRTKNVPICNLVPGGTADVTCFGAAPDDDVDDTAAFVAAANAVRAQGLRRLLIPTGVYRLSAGGNPQNKNSLLCFQNINGLQIESPCAGLLISGDTGVFSFDGCRGVTVSGITVDWPRPPFSVGTVKASTPNSFDIAIEPEYPVAGGEPVGAFMDYDRISGRPRGRDIDVYDAVTRTELVAPQRLRVHLSRPVSVPAGTLLVLRHKVYGCNVFNFSRCSDVQITNSLIHAAPGMGLFARVCKNVSLRHFDIYKQVVTPPRRLSTNADAAHFFGCTGTITIEDCHFADMGDDGVNVKSGLYLSVLRRLNKRSVLCRHNLKMIDLPDPGDTLEMSHADQLLPFASNRVHSAELVPGDDNLHRIVFEAPLPDDLRESDLLGNATRTPVFRMRRCTVRDNRARGVLCQTRDAVIEDCMFIGCTSAGVLVLTEAAHFFESIGTRHVVVRNNRFEHCNHGAASAEAALCALAYLKGFQYPPHPGVHRDVRFENNLLFGSDESAIFATSVDGLTLFHNNVKGACQRASRPSGSTAIAVQNCSRADLSNNTFDRWQGEHFIYTLRTEPPAPAN